MQDLHRNLIIVENRSSFSVNALFDDAIIERQIVDRGYKLVFQLIFADGAAKLVALRRVALVGTNPYRTHYYTSSTGKVLGEYDFLKDFKWHIEHDCQGDGFDVVLGGGQAELQAIQPILGDYRLIDPYPLIDKDYFKGE